MLSIVPLEDEKKGAFKIMQDGHEKYDGQARGQLSRLCVACRRQFFALSFRPFVLSQGGLPRNSSPILVLKLGRRGA